MRLWNNRSNISLLTSQDIRFSYKERDSIKILSPQKKKRKGEVEEYGMWAKNEPAQLVL